MALSDMIGHTITTLPQDQNDLDNTPMNIVAPEGINSAPAGYNTMPNISQESIQSMTSQISPNSHPLITAIDTGYADKKVMGPVDDIRKGILSNDVKLLEKGGRKLVDALTGHMTFSERFQDAYFRHGEGMANAHKMASDIIMKEIAHATGIGMPSAEEATRLGLIKPEELVPGAQSETIPGAPPGYTGFTPSMEPIAAPQRAPVTRPTAGARLTPFQTEIVGSRQKAIQQGIAYKAALATSRGLLADEKAQTEQYKRENLLPTQIQSMKSLDKLRQAQGKLATTRADFISKLPDLRRELSGKITPFELEALKRVHASIQKHEPIDKADWLIFQKWLGPVFSADFMGNIFNRLTGQKGQKGSPFGWADLPEPPSTSMTEEQQAEATDIDQDMFHQFGTMLGSLLQGVIGKAEPEAKPETGLSAAEKSELEQLRKKHGRK